MAFGNHPFDSSSSRELRHGIRPRFSLVCSSRTMGSSDGKKNDEDFLIGTRWSPEIMTFCRQAIIIFRDNLSWLVLVLSLLMNLALSSYVLIRRTVHIQHLNCKYIYLMDFWEEKISTKKFPFQVGISKISTYCLEKGTSCCYMW